MSNITFNDLRISLQTSDDTTLLRQAIDNGFDINMKDSSNTLLIWACFYGRSGCVRILLDNNADPNIVDDFMGTPLLYAASIGNVECIQMLINSNANIDHIQNAGYTALHIAAVRGHVNSVLYLLDYGADPSYQDKHGNTASIIARKIGYIEIADIIDNYHGFVKPALEISEY